jgi:hypothetical protein
VKEDVGPDGGDQQEDARLSKDPSSWILIRGFLESWFISSFAYLGRDSDREGAPPSAMRRQVAQVKAPPRRCLLQGQLLGLEFPLRKP